VKTLLQPNQQLAENERKLMPALVNLIVTNSETCLWEHLLTCWLDDTLLLLEDIAQLLTFFDEEPLAACELENLEVLCFMRTFACAAFAVSASGKSAPNSPPPTTTTPTTTIVAPTSSQSDGVLLELRSRDEVLALRHSALTLLRQVVAAASTDLNRRALLTYRKLLYPRPSVCKALYSLLYAAPIATTNSVNRANTNSSSSSSSSLQFGANALVDPTEFTCASLRPLVLSILCDLFAFYPTVEQEELLSHVIFLLQRLDRLDNLEIGNGELNLDSALSACLQLVFNGTLCFVLLFCFVLFCCLVLFSLFIFVLCLNLFVIFLGVLFFSCFESPS
jgi:hypothetical protein